MRTVLRMAPWSRAPALLLRHPAVLAAVVAGAAVVGATAAAPALFASSAGNAVQSRQVEARCPATVGPVIQQAAPTAAFDRAVRAAAADPGFGDPITTFATHVTGVASGGGRTTRLTLLSRTGALDHVRRLRRGGPADRVWLTPSTATRLGLAPGDLLHLQGATVTVPVAGTYKDVKPQVVRDPLEPYWCGQSRRHSSFGSSR